MYRLIAIFNIVTVAQTFQFIYLNNGTIKAYEVPTSPHSTAAGTIMDELYAWDHQNLRPKPGAASDNLGNPYPSMIIEVCNTQSLPDHHQKVALYFSLRTTIPNRIGN
ncbi:unnamed protein product [Rhizophagus irregularis]|nr:unnamed protein product [Rhizophagus irregularis]